MHVGRAGALCAGLIIWSQGLVYAATTLGPPHPREPVCGKSLIAAADATRAKLNPCVVQQDKVLLETTYYQNASKVGGTALAAYPELRIRGGIARRLEFVFDAPSNVARSGNNGQGVFYFTHPGLGLKWALLVQPRLAVSLGSELTPPRYAMSYMHVLPRVDITASAAWQPPRSNIVLSAQAGFLKFRQSGNGLEERTTGMFTVSAMKEVAHGTWLTVQLRNFTQSAQHAGGQSSGALSLQHALGTNVLTNVQIGTAFGAAGNSKAHYLGFGFTIRP